MSYMTNRMFDDFILINNVPVMIKSIGNNSYDYNFRNYFECKSVLDSIQSPIILRVGAIADYKLLEKEVRNMGLRLAMTFEEHQRASELSYWYPIISEYTPFSKVYKEFPDIEEVLKEFSFPIFVKGNRQTNKHNKKLCIIENEDMFKELEKHWKVDSILHWQDIVVREYVNLQKVDELTFPDMVPFSYEFRMFFWKNKLVAYGPYWTLGAEYILDAYDKNEAFSLATKVAEIINVPFLAVDIAKTNQGEWVVIEINDAQESGYVGVDRNELWRNIVDLEDSLRH